MAAEKEKIVRSRTVSFRDIHIAKVTTNTEQNTRRKHRQSWHARSQERSVMNLKLKKFTVMIRLKM